MTLLDIISTLESFDVGDTIYCLEPWAPDALALVATEPEAGGLPDEATRLGLSYFLEIDISKEVLEGWMENIDFNPSLEQKCVRVVQYAINDA